MDAKHPHKADAAAPSRCPRCESTALVVRPNVGAVCADCGSLLIFARPTRLPAATR
jgi:hypothetical protein